MLIDTHRQVYASRTQLEALHPEFGVFLGDSFFYLRLVTHFKFLIVGLDQKMVTKRL